MSLVFPQFRGHFWKGSYWVRRSVMGKRRKFSAEFKREAVALTAAPDVSVAQVAPEGIADV